MYTFKSRIRYSEADCEGKLSLYSLLNYFQDSSTFHSEDLGLGLSYMKEQNMIWVLSSWQIVVERYPAMGENVEIGTFPYDFKGFLGYRNFFMKDEKGQYLAKANSIWSLLDIGTGKPSKPTDAMLQGYIEEEKLPMEYAPRKIALPEGGTMQEAVVVTKHHLDTNHHVNNGQYVDVAMAYLPEDFVVGQLRVEYKQQAYLDDVFHPYVVSEGNRICVSLLDGNDKPYAIVEFSRM